MKQTHKNAISGKKSLKTQCETRLLGAFSMQRAAGNENAVVNTPPLSRERVVSAPHAHNTHKKYPKTAVISTGSMTAMQLSACATVKAMFEPVENTVDGFSALNKDPKTTVFAKVSASFRRKLGSRTQVLRHKYAKTAVDAFPALNKYEKTVVDGLPAFNKHPKTAVDGLSSLEERTKTAVDGILSHRGRVTTAVAALSYGFSARFALGYSITQKIKRGIFL